MLFTAGIMQTFSMYTFSLYIPWQPKDISQNPWNTEVLEPPSERKWRIMWVIIPNVGFMFTSALPSLSNTEGYKLALALVHNVCAPCSMLFCLVMETFQLAFGEGIFLSFFTDDVPHPYQKPSDITRIRLIVAFYSWGFGALFIGIQVYLGLPLVGVKIQRRYWLALVSFYSEVLSMLFAFFLPVLAAWETFANPTRSLSTMDEAALMLHDMFNLTSQPPMLEI